MEESASVRLLKRYAAFRRRHEFYSQVLGCRVADSRAYWTEIQSNRKLVSELFAAQHSRWRDSADAGMGSRITGGFIERIFVPGAFAVTNAELYVIVRSLKPAIVVETGVAAGISSAIILEAMRVNKFGRLFSVDLPNADPAGYINADGVRDSVYTPPELGSGWIVPDYLRERWSLLIGPSRDVLPSLLGSVGNIDMFYHDSDHSKANMLFELNLAWSKLAKGGCLYVDDVSWNDAFGEFVMRIGLVGKHAFSPAYRGLVVKPL
jgi:predicted O-methyltransferase YrrM